MRVLTKKQISKINDWILENARLFDKAKWNYLINGGSEDDIQNEMLKYQNIDGGFGNGFESDIQFPGSAAIPSAEAIFQLYEYNLDGKQQWLLNLLNYFENSIMDIPSFWLDAPKEFIDYPHAPWWRYKESVKFSPNPSAVIASAFIKYGTENQKIIGNDIAKKCFEFLLSDEECGEHDCYNLIKLIETLISINSSLITEEIINEMKNKIAKNVCYDDSKWTEYYAQPLDFINNSKSMWLDTVKSGIENNFNYWLDNLNEEGIWQPNFSWGVDSDIAKKVTRDWKGFITVKRVKLFMEFNRIEL